MLKVCFLNAFLIFLYFPLFADDNIVAPERLKPIDSEIIIKIDPVNACSDIQKGCDYFNQQYYDTALIIFNRSYALHPDENVAFLIGDSYIELNIIDSAVIYLNAAARKNKNFFYDELLLARAYFKQCKYLAAASEFEKIAYRVELCAMDQYSRAISLEKTGNIEASLLAYMAAVDQFGATMAPEAINSRLKVAIAMLNEKKYEDALYQFLTIADADSQAEIVNNIYSLLSDAYIGVGDSESATESLEKALSLDDKNTDIYVRLVDIYENRNRQDSLQKIYDTLAFLFPNDSRVFMEIGEHDFAKQQYAWALKYFDKALSIDNSVRAATGVSLSAVKCGQLDKARTAAETAIKLDPSLTEPRSVLADAFIRDKNFSQARDQLVFIVCKKPDDINSWKRLIECYVNLNEISLRVEADKKIAALDTTDAESRMRLADYALSQKDDKTAFKLYMQVANLRPNDALVVKKLFDITLNSGDKNNAAIYARKYLDLNPHDATTQKTLGDIFYELKKNDDAFTAYDAALKIDPTMKGIINRYAKLIGKGQDNFPELPEIDDKTFDALSIAVKLDEAGATAYGMMGAIYMKKKGDCKNALELLKKAVLKGSRNSEILILLAKAQVCTKDSVGALISYENAIMMNPKLVNEYRELGDLYSAQNKPEKAIDIYRTFLYKMPNDQSVIKKIGLLFFIKKQFDDAISYFEKINDTLLIDNKYLLILGECYLNTNNYKGIELTYGKLCGRAANDYSINIRQALKLMADAYEKDNNLNKALEAYATYMALPGEKDPDIFYKAAFIQERINFLQCKKSYENNITTFPNDYRNYLRLGIIFSKNKNTLKNSIELLKKASSLADSIPLVWLEIARVYGSLGNKTEEFNACKKILSLDPNNPEGNKLLGKILLSDNVTEALIYLEIARMYLHKDIELLTMLKDAYIKLNMLDEAIAEIVKLKDLKVNDLELRKQLIDLYLTTHQDKNALNEMKQFITINKDKNFFIMYIKALFADSQYKEAEEAIMTIKKNDPENIEVRMILGEIKRIRKNYDEAIEVYKEIFYINSNYAPGICKMGEIYLLQGKTLQAEEKFEAAIKTDPKSAHAELGLAKIAKFGENKVLYLKHLVNAMLLDSKDPEILEEYKKREEEKNPKIP